MDAMRIIESNYNDIHRCIAMILSMVIHTITSIIMMMMMMMMIATTTLLLEDTHPGAMPPCSVEQAFEAIKPMVHDKPDPFDFGAYKELTRSQQINAEALAHNEPWLVALAAAGTGLRFKFTVLAKAAEKAIKTAPDDIPLGK